MTIFRRRRVPESVVGLDTGIEGASLLIPWSSLP
jgi:hypothetical protein